MKLNLQADLKPMANKVSVVRKYDRVTNSNLEPILDKNKYLQKTFSRNNDALKTAIKNFMRKNSFISKNHETKFWTTKLEEEFVDVKTANDIYKAGNNPTH